ncbi:inner membrane protein YiaA [Cupriavidus basilensis]
MNYTNSQQPSFAFVAASWAALLAGILAFLIGLFNADMQLNEKGYYFTVLVYGLFAAVSVQKSVRDRLEGIPVTGIYYGLSWLSVLLAVLLLCVGLFNATLALSEKGFYAMSFALALFGAIAVQKNTRDTQAARPTSINADAVRIINDGAAPGQVDEA